MFKPRVKEFSMRRYAPLSLALLGAALAAPGSARAWQEPIPIASPSSPATVMAPSAAPAPAPVPIDHKHYGRVKRGLVPCEKCQAAQKAGKVYQLTPSSPMPATPAGHEHVHAMQNPMGIPEGSQIVGCVHSQNGVCKECRKFLEMPGQVTMAVPGTPATTVASAPGRAVASDAAPGIAVAEAEPEPIGVMKTNYSQATRGATAKPAQPAMPVGPGSSPYAPQTDEHNPHVISHLFGFSAWQRDWKDMWESKSRSKRAAHAAVSYDAPPEKPAYIPASSVYGPAGSPR
jgi:hypothetical protein